jgi:MoxR-like ATPase
MKNAPHLELSLLARQWGATAAPFGEGSAQAGLETPQSQRALGLLDQTATLRSVLLLAGPNGVGKSALVGRWFSRLDRRLFCPRLLTLAPA